MTNPTTEKSLPKIYSITALLAFMYSVLLIVFAIYKQFFYVDRTWFHGFTSNGFAVLSNLLWLGILIVFKVFLNQILKYNKANSVLIASFVFLGIAILSVSSVLMASLKIYFADETDEINSLTSFASTSISGAIWLVIANIGMIVTTILLGNSIRKIDVILKNRFTILGFSLIALGVCSILQAVSLISTDMVVFFVKAFTVAVLGYILKEATQMDYNELTALLKLETNNKVNSQVKVYSKSEFERSEKMVKKEEIFQEQEVIPNFDINELEDKELIRSYFGNLSKDELSRLENVVAKKYNQNFTEVEIKNLVLQYIADKKLYDHDRFAPK